MSVAAPSATPSRVTPSIRRRRGFTRMRLNCVMVVSVVVMVVVVAGVVVVVVVVPMLMLMRVMVPLLVRLDVMVVMCT